MNDEPQHDPEMEKALRGRDVAMGAALGLAPAPAAEREPLYDDVFSFFDYMLAPSFPRHVIGYKERKWCAHWSEHLEALQRITGLHLLFEQTYDRHPTALLTWYREADYHLGQLMDPAGPFASCTADPGGHNRYQQVPPLPSEHNAPEDLHIVEEDYL